MALPMHDAPALMISLSFKFM